MPTSEIHAASLSPYRMVLSVTLLLSAVLAAQRERTPATMDPILALRDARAAAVKAAPVTDFDIAAERITTKGLGDASPAAPSATAEGQAQNRRVEMVER